jgi:limonene-1,2-epoxide hydrolase
MRLDPQALGEPAVPLGDAVGPQRRGAVRRQREYERVLVEVDVERLGADGAPSMVLDEQLDGLRVERDPAGLVRLGVLLPLQPGELALALPDRQDTSGEV